MIQSLKVSAEVDVLESHNLHWAQSVEMSIDCFICERSRRTTKFELGAERGVCSGSRSGGSHFAPGRVSAFDTGHEVDRLTVEVVLDYWFAPFLDVKEDTVASALPRPSWVRLNLGYLCPDTNTAGHFSTPTNVVRPFIEACQHCSHPIARGRLVPQVRLLR